MQRPEHEGDKGESSFTPGRGWTPGLSRSRRVAGLAVATLGLPLLTSTLVTLRGALAVGSILLIYLLAVVAVAVLGGIVPALLAALASFLLVNWFLTPPYYTFAVESRDAIVDLVVFMLVAVIVSVTVDLGARHREAAERIRFESRLVSELGSAESSGDSLMPVLESVRALFDMSAVVLLDPASPSTEPLALVGPRPDGSPSMRVTTVNDLELAAYGPQVFAEDRRLFGGLADVAARAWEGQELAKQAALAHQLAETDRVRSALLTAVSHDLRTPLAGIKVAVSSLRQSDVSWTAEERDELLQTVEESADRLTALISNLLAMSRIQAGALSVQLGPVALDEVVARSVIRTSPRVTTEVPEDLPLVRADAVLLERVLANLVDNALRYSPDGQPVLVHAEVLPATAGKTGAQPQEGRCEARLHVTDQGPGIKSSQWEALFVPFHRLGDQDAIGGLGLGLAIARGFTEAMSGQLTPSMTPGGGLTMTVSLPVER
jgi:K+-sensing histidine kinase KdpD